MEKKIRELYSAQKIGDRVRELGAQIAHDYKGQELVIVGVLKGSFMFMADLARSIPSHEVHIDFLGLASYGDETKSSGVVQITADLSKPVDHKHVLVVEDIVDTGHTLHHVTRFLATRKPARLRTIALLDKPSRRELEFKADWIGFSIPDEFVVGYGIDFAQRNRNLPYIGKVRFTGPGQDDADPSRGVTLE